MSKRIFSDAERDYGTNFMKEVQKLNGKPYYAPRRLPEAKKAAIIRSDE